MVRDQPVHQAPSANLVAAFNELKKLGQSPEVEKTRAKSWQHRSRSMRFGIRFCLIHPLQCTAVVLIAMVEASIGTTNAMNT